jgi:L-idonate 5-dehydrogenase
MVVQSGPGTRYAEALVIRGAGRLSIEKTRLPAMSESDVLVDVRFGGICGSDLSYWRHGSSGSSVLREPMVLGHEIVGLVQQEAADGLGPNVGTPVAIYPGVACGRCAACLASRRNLCPFVKFMGSAAQFPHTDGGFASSIVVPRSSVRALPADNRLDKFALVEPASVAWHAVSRTQLGSDTRALVIGAGPIGLILVAILRLRGVRHITVSDIETRPLETALQLGANEIIQVGVDESTKQSSAPDVVFECSGSVVGLGQAIRQVRPGGDVVLIGNQRVGDVEFPAALAISKELRIAASFRCNDEFDEVIAALSSGVLDLAPVVSDVVDWKNFDHAFALAADSRNSSKVLLAIGNSSSGG